MDISISVRTRGSMHRVYSVGYNRRCCFVPTSHVGHGVTKPQQSFGTRFIQQIQKDKEMTSYLLGQATENWSLVAYKFWMQMHVETQKQMRLFCLRMRSDKVDRWIDGVNFLCFIVRDLEGEFFLERHHNLNSVQAIKSKVLLEMGSRCHLQFVGETWTDYWWAVNIYNATIHEYFLCDGNSLSSIEPSLQYKLEKSCHILMPPLEYRSHDKHSCTFY